MLISQTLATSLQFQKVRCTNINFSAKEGREDLEEVEIREIIKKGRRETRTMIEEEVEVEVEAEVEEAEVKGVDQETETETMHLWHCYKTARGPPTTEMTEKLREEDLQ